MTANPYSLGSRFRGPGRARSDGRNRWGPALLLAGMAALYFVTTRPAPIPEGWGTDYGAAFAEAAAEDRKVLIAFYMQRCPPCTAMDRMVLSTSAVKSALAAYIPVRVDVDEQRELANRFEVLATPTYAVVDAEGGVLARCEGYQPVETFIKFLTRWSVMKLGRPN